MLLFFDLGIVVNEHRALLGADLDHRGFQETVGFRRTGKDPLESVLAHGETNNFTVYNGYTKTLGVDHHFQGFSLVGVIDVEFSVTVTLSKENIGFVRHIGFELDETSTHGSSRSEGASFEALRDERSHN